MNFELNSCLMLSLSPFNDKKIDTYNFYESQKVRSITKILQEEFLKLKPESITYIDLRFDFVLIDFIVFFHDLNNLFNR